MRRVLVSSQVMSVLASAACVAAPPPSNPQQVDAEILAAASQPSAPVPIVIREQSNVCVSVHVDQRVWPTPLLPDADRNFSGMLATALSHLYEQAGGSYHLPGPQQVPRFITNQGGTNPSCQDRGEDVYVTVNYSLREDGRPFAFAYRIEQGAAVRSGSATRDIEEEWRTGSLPHYHKTQPLADAVIQDIRQRAGLIFSNIH